MLRRRHLLIALLTIALPVLLLVWLLFTQSGLHSAAALLTQALGGRLQLEQLSGRLGDRLQIGKLQWTSDTTTLVASAVTFDWSPRALGRGVLEVAALHIGALDIATQDNGEPPQMPASLTPAAAHRYPRAGARSLACQSATGRRTQQRGAGR